jgi:hypothetical protein
MGTDQAITITSSEAVDRHARDALAELIIAYMKGEIDGAEFEDRKGESLQDNQDPSVRVLDYDLWLIHDDSADHPMSVPHETWDWLLRVIAFLRTDLGLVSERRSMWHRKQLVAGGGLLLIGCGVTMSMATASWIPLILCWATAGTLAMFYAQRYRDCVHPEIEALGRYAPFRSEAQWQRYRPLVAAANIPTYNPAFYPGSPSADAEVQPTSWKWLLLGPFSGVLGLPWMLRRIRHEIHVVK